jgi:hypothetical protein
MEEGTEAYTPNKVPRRKRIFGGIWSSLIVIYGVIGLYYGQLWIPGLGAASGVVFTGNSLIVLLIAIGLSCCNLLLPIADHFDKRNNEHIYKKLEKSFAFASVALIIYASLMAHNYI